MANENPNRQPPSQPGQGPDENFPGKAPNVYGQKEANQQQGQNPKPERQPQQGGTNQPQHDTEKKNPEKQPDDSADRNRQPNNPAGNKGR